VFVQPLLEADEILALHGHTLVAFAAYVFRKFVSEYGANFLAEGKVFITQRRVHGAPRVGAGPFRGTRLSQNAFKGSSQSCKMEE
jgi:hypothetical protein